jgi:tight adherence protein B
MEGIVLYTIIGVLGLFAVGGAGYAFVGASGDKSRKRISAIKNSGLSKAPLKGGDDANQQRRKNVQAMLKDLEAKQAEKKERISLRRRIALAGLEISVQTFWIFSVVVGLVLGAITLFYGQHILFVVLAAFAGGLGLPRWGLTFLKNRREKAFTKEFANGVDIIVRSVKSGLPVNEALKVVADEIPDPVGSEFHHLVENLKVGLPMDQALTRMYERMPTAEVNFFCIVVTIQSKSGGNLSEALTNLSGILRERKRMQGKIKAMSSEAKTGAMIIAALPPIVLISVYMTNPAYISLLFTTDLGNLMLIGCGFWMSLGVLVMKKMVSFKY